MIKKNSGLTLVELLITVAILVMLIAVSWAILDPFQQRYKAFDAVSRSTIVEFEQGAQRYGSANNAYPWNQSNCIVSVTPTPTINATPTPTSAFPMSGIFSYYKMDEASPTTMVADSVGSNTGTMQGTNASTQITTSGKINNGRIFNGSDNYVLLPSSTIMTPNTGFSVSFWIYPTTIPSDHKAPIALKGTNGQFLIAWGKSGNTGLGGHTIDMGFSDANVAILCDRNGSYIDQVQNTWTNMVVTYNGAGKTTGGNYFVYFNGNQVSCVGSSTFGPSAVNNEIGGYSADSTQFVGGTMDEVGIWSRVLSQAEVTTLYNSGSALAYPGIPIATPTPIAIVSAYVTLPPATSLNSINSCVQTMADRGDIKEGLEHVTSDVASGISLFQPDPYTPNNLQTLLMCFQPKSKISKKDPLYKYTSAGLPTCDPTTNSCYICISQ